MKKILFTIILLLVFICDVKAFNIDMDKISVTGKVDKTISSLDKKYDIDLEGFVLSSSNDNRAIAFSKKIVNLTFNNKGTESRKKDLTNYLYISNDDGFETLSGVMFLDVYLKTIEDNDISLGRIVDVRTASFNQNDIISFVYVKNALVNGEEKDIVLSYWLKDNGGEYKVFYPWISFNDNVKKHFEEIGYIEETGKIIGEAYNKMSLDGNENTFIDENKLYQLYQDNKESVVQITSMGDVNNYGSGFYLSEGFVVTTWSLFLQFLTEGNYIYVNDCNGNTYDVLGVVSAQPTYDVVVLKIDEKVGKKVTLGNSNEVYSSNKLFTINSKYNSGFSINYGTNISYSNGRYKNMFALSASDVGSALFNDYGEVVGINVGDKLYSELSYANSTDYLKTLQYKLVNNDYEKIKYTKLDTFKKKYYITVDKEDTYKQVNDDIWNKYNKVSSFEEKIKMDLLKASHRDGILSLRYKNDTKGMLDSIYLASDFTEYLTNHGFKLTFYNDQKHIYKSEEYQIILKDNFNYLIVLIMEI